MASTTRTEEAAGLFEEIIQDVTASRLPLPEILMKAYHACGLAGLSPQWLEQELYGYNDEEEVPWYRRQIPGTVTWQFAGPPSLTVFAQRLDFSGPEPAETVATDWRASIWVVDQHAQQGVQNHLPDTREQSWRYGTYEQRKVVTYHPGWVQRIRDAVATEVVRKASSAVIALRYGDAVQGIWDAYRATVDAALARLNMGADFENVRENIASTNHEQWRSAMWACRTVLHNLAARLWTDPLPTYRPLNNMRVDGNSPINRLLAYLHCKGVTGAARKYLQSELDRINASLHALSDLDNKAHDAEPVTREDALLAVVATYTVLAQFARRTDLEPVGDQAVCLAGGSEG